MNILFINCPKGPDYLCDAVLHGLKERLGRQVVETSIAQYMYDRMNFIRKARLYGRGFTLYGKLDSKLRVTYSYEKIVTNIKRRHYDKIVFGSIWRCLDYLDLIKEYYQKDRVIFIDGEDHDEINFDLIPFGKYYKRELTHADERIHPISFAVPGHLILKSVPIKKKRLATVIPGDKSTYKFYLEKSYYKDYQESIFAYTWKKAGWDCMRHYEILLNGCIPIFRNLELCPARTMVNFPKECLIDLDLDFTEGQYRKLVEYLIEYTKLNLTTNKLASSILEC